MNTFTGTQDVIDSRDILERIEELTNDFLCGVESGELGLDDFDMTFSDWLSGGLDYDDAVEVFELIRFREEYDGQFGDYFTDGVTFVHEDYFTEFAKDSIEDMGYVVPNEMPAWIVIDWEATAENFREYYTEVEFLGQTYWAR